ncbi:MAG: aldose 1-epimerase [Ruminococcaceae bacterium]|nr:aldose 1-epimerase [Oscillospiraceae bacterium]
MQNARVFEGEYLGIKTIEFECGGYTGAFITDGAKLIRLDYSPKNIKLIRNTASNADELRERRIFGMPVLFFPNRTTYGRFKFEGRTYQLPINTKAPYDMNIHGFLNGFTTWNIAKKEATDNCVNITFEYIIDKTKKCFEYFDFNVKIVYENIITPDGLSQNIIFDNMSDKNMPFGFAYHTAFNIPFNDSPKDAFYIKANLKSKYELGYDTIPTGKLLPLSEFQNKALGKLGVPSHKETLDDLFLADDNTANISVITDANTNTRVFYEADESFKHWILYNETKNSDFVCIEPQTWATNALNMDMESANLIVIKAGEKLKLSTKLYVKI